MLKSATMSRKPPRSVAPRRRATGPSRPSSSRLSSHSASAERPLPEADRDAGAHSGDPPARRSAPRRRRRRRDQPRRRRRRGPGASSRRARRSSIGRRSASDVVPGACRIRLSVTGDSGSSVRRATFSPGSSTLCCTQAGTSSPGFGVRHGVRAGLQPLLGRAQPRVGGFLPALHRRPRRRHGFGVHERVHDKTDRPDPVGQQRGHTDGSDDPHQPSRRTPPPPPGAGGRPGPASRRAAAAACPEKLTPPR